MEDHCFVKWSGAVSVAGPRSILRECHIGCSTESRAAYFAVERNLDGCGTDFDRKISGNPWTPRPEEIGT